MDPVTERNGYTPRLDAQELRDIATSNACCAYDQAGTYRSLDEAVRQYRLNVIDSLGKREMSPRDILWVIEIFETEIKWYIRRDQPSRWKIVI